MSQLIIRGCQAGKGPPSSPPPHTLKSTKPGGGGPYLFLYDNGTTLQSNSELFPLQPFSSSHFWQFHSIKAYLMLISNFLGTVDYHSSYRRTQTTPPMTNQNKRSNVVHSLCTYRGLGLYTQILIYYLPDISQLCLAQPSKSLFCTT